jgi:3',5'-nucleoside bisphosphate phosphatase
MIPPLIVARAIEVGLDIIAITDHNSAENVEAVIEAARGTALKVLPGMECETVEGVHMVCIFDEVSAALALQGRVYEKLPNLPNRPETFGAQFVVDRDGEFIRYNDRLLLVPSELSIEEIWSIAQDLGGLAFPSHVDRSAYGIYGVLGFMPGSPVFPAVEISSRITAEEAQAKYPDLNGKRIFCCSDAHRLIEMGSAKTMLELGHRTVAEIRMRSDK